MKEGGKEARKGALRGPVYGIGALVWIGFAIARMTSYNWRVTSPYYSPVIRANNPFL
jgi:hypothetical protein